MYVCMYIPARWLSMPLDTGIRCIKKKKNEKPSDHIHYAALLVPPAIVIIRKLKVKLKSKGLAAILLINRIRHADPARPLAPRGCARGSRGLWLPRAGGSSARRFFSVPDGNPILSLRSTITALYFRLECFGSAWTAAGERGLLPPPDHLRTAQTRRCTALYCLRVLLPSFPPTPHPTGFRFPSGAPHHVC